MSKNAVLIKGWRQSIESRLLAVDGWSGRWRPALALQEACRYVSQGGGKRLRGLLTCAVAQDLAAAAEKRAGDLALSAAVALELLHAASLVHDDLPALDNDDERRGRAACHKVFGEATAILTGDALVGAAFMVVTSDRDLSSDNQARISRTLSHAWWDLCLGQQMDINQQGGAEAVAGEQMVRLKTGALFGAAVGCAAICAGVREADLERYIEWGTKIGECFQALDDLNDGDRSAADRGAIEATCAEVVGGAQVLDVRLASGVTRDVVGLVLG